MSVLLDTCATYHMCSWEECFDSLVESPVKEVHAGGGEPHVVIGQGSVTIQTDFGPVYLLDVLCVPTLKANSCSWPAASRAGAVLTTVAGRLVVKNADGDVLFTPKLLMACSL
jgi:hypothetical protein